VRAIASGGGNCYFLALIIRRWLKKLIEIIAHAYFLGEGVMYLLQEAIHAVYKAAGVYKGSNKTLRND